jgi:succinate dehydrogenase/fumarate reductase flavoprotein subunit
MGAGKSSATGISRRGFVFGATALGAGLTLGLAGCSQPNGSGAGNTTDGALGSSEGMTAGKYLETWSFEIPPAPIAEDEIAETIEADVIVVGAGTSGLVAANSALDHGLNVCLITASSIPVYRGGSNHAIMSKTKRSFNLEPGSELLFEREIICNGMSADQRKWYKYYNNSEEAMDWLIDIMESKGYETGLEPQIEFIEGGNFFSFVGAHGFMTQESHSMGMNQQYVVDELASRLEEAGKPVFYKNTARQLIREDNNTGRVAAVVAEREDGSFAKYVGKKAIILATGDFSSNRDMMYKYAPYTAQIISDEMYDAEPNYDRCFEYGGLFPGDGQQMGLWIGAAWQKGWPCTPMGGAIGAGPSNRTLIFSGLRVDRNGERFMNEYGVRDMGGYTNRIQPGGSVSAIWNNDYATKFPFNWVNGAAPYGSEDSTLPPEKVIANWGNSVESGNYFKADTLDELVEKMGLPARTLDTIARYNEMCHAGKDSDFHKDPHFLIPLDDGPFYGQTGASPLFLTILGGLRTNSNMQVCDTDDMPIPGLYNVGTMVGDMYGVNYTFQIPGFNLGATCVTFGYMTGRFIAENEK